MNEAISRDDVIRMAKESGFKASVGKTDKEGNYHPYVNALSKDIPVEWLERFAALAALRAQPDHSELVRECLAFMQKKCDVNRGFIADYIALEEKLAKALEKTNV